MDAKTEKLDARLRPIFDAIQIGRTVGVSCYEVLGVVEHAFGLTEYGYANDRRVNRKIDAPEKRERRKHYTPAYKQKLYDRQGGTCPWCPKPLFVPAKRNEVDHINVNLPPEEYESKRNHCLTHPNCNRSKSSKNIFQVSKETGLLVTEILAKGQ